ncbi:MAG: SDR family oxidoreductase [Nannocystis sp.]|uniref:SDR family oxidoreductase n=1 Tax=Nannocystis sp. TaxID=1962667 RepID=UPI0024227E17|nr:SDR family oxidoreductase [Nannocystis sp.]MBK9756891.1 SDR family oxidoreductase [Nannocystis sp.]
MPARRFFLTGCASGIGRHLAEVLLAAGHEVFATDLDEAGLRTHAAANPRAWPVERVHLRRLDVTQAGAWQLVFAEAERVMGRVDVLINIAGYLLPGFVGDFDPESVHRHLDVNTKGVIFGTHTAARHMLARGDGHIINIASLAALAPIPGISLYSASKYAVRGFSLAAAQELRPRGVAVSVVCPDAVQTPMLDLQVGYKEAALTFSGSRILSVADVADAIVHRVLPRRPLELHLPRSRALLARLADLFPGTALWLRPILERRGLARQRKLAKHRG